MDESAARPNEQADTHAIDVLIHQRPRILRTKLAVLATQIQERLRIRVASKERIDHELTFVADQIVVIEEAIACRVPFDISLRNLLLEQQAKLTAEGRQEDAAAWRDLAQAMNDFLTTWEALEQSHVRAQFLQQQNREDRTE